MKHARAEALDTLEPLLAEIRAYTGLKERTRGVFYRRGRSFLHFHEDAAGLFADLANDGNDLRLRVSDAAEHTELLAVISRVLAAY